MIRVSCINKLDRYDPSERIQNVGGINADRSRWKLSQQEAIRWTEDPNKEDFYVEVNGDRVRVVVRISRYGNKYLTTQPDGEEQNNLLSLPECP